MVPLVGNGRLGASARADALLVDVPRRDTQGAAPVTLPDVWFVYRTNPAISFWDTKAMGEKIARLPYVVAMAYTMDETNHFADILLPGRPPTSRPAADPHR